MKSVELIQRVGQFPHWHGDTETDADVRKGSCFSREACLLGCELAEISGLAEAPAFPKNGCCSAQVAGSLRLIWVSKGHVPLTAFMTVNIPSLACSARVSTFLPEDSPVVPVTSFESFSRGTHSPEPTFSPAYGMLLLKPTIGAQIGS